jgi:hypothetical protein
MPYPRACAQTSDLKSAVAPVSRNLAKSHEALLLRDCAQLRVGPEAGECLSKAPFKSCCEVAHAILARRAIEPIASLRILKQAEIYGLAEAQWLRRSADSPETALGRLDNLRLGGRHLSPGEERLGCHKHVAERPLTDALRWGVIVQLWIQPKEPRTDGMGRLLSEKELESLVSATEALLVLCSGRTLAGCPARDSPSV